MLILQKFATSTTRACFLSVRVNSHVFPFVSFCTSDCCPVISAVHLNGTTISLTSVHPCSQITDKFQTLRTYGRARMHMHTTAMPAYVHTHPQHPHASTYV